MRGQSQMVVRRQIDDMVMIDCRRGLTHRQDTQLTIEPLLLGIDSSEEKGVRAHPGHKSQVRSRRVTSVGRATSDFQ